MLTNISCYITCNVKKLYFDLFETTLKILAQIWFRKIWSLGTLVIALSKELLTLILTFRLLLPTYT